MLFRFYFVIYFKPLLGIKVVNLCMKSHDSLYELPFLYSILFHDGVTTTPPITAPPCVMNFPERVVMIVSALDVIVNINFAFMYLITCGPVVMKKAELSIFSGSIPSRNRIFTISFKASCRVLYVVVNSIVFDFFGIPNF